MHLVPRKLCAQFSVCLALVIVVFLAVPSPGQIPQMGIPPFSTIQNGPDQVNLSDLSMHYKIPVFARPGRGIPFSFTINIDNIIWGPDSLGKWQFTNTLGDGWFSGLGAVFYSSTQKTCFWDADNPKHPYTEWRFNSFVDSSGAGHPFGLTVNNLNSSSGFCIPKSSATGISGDGAGVSMSVTYPLSATVTLANGDVIHAPLATVLTPGVLSITSTGPYTWTDSNGNRITENWNAGTLNFSNIVDTLGTTALSFSKTSNSQSFTYTNPSGAAVSVVKHLSAHTIETLWGCPGLQNFGPTAENLIDRIDLPDGTYYQFTYEPSVNGHTNGRLASVRLPTGGVVQYSYSGGSNGTGMSCDDFGTVGLTRTTPDGAWTYSRTVTFNQYGAVSGSVVTITDPQSNQTVVTFAYVYETQRQVYNGNASGTPLQTVITCYNGAALSNCLTTPGPPRTESNVYSSLDGGPQSRVDTFFNSYGQVTEKDEYDFGASIPTRKTSVTYASVGGGVNDRPSIVKVTDGSNNFASETDSVYDEDLASLQSSGSLQLVPPTCGSGTCRGNLTTRKDYTSAAAFLTKTFAHYDNGKVYQATDARGAITAYTYGACGNSLLTNVAMPLNLSKSSTWNCTGAVMASSTDENGQTSNYSYVNPSTGVGDPLWRVTRVTNPDGGQTTASYNDTASPPNVQTSTLIITGMSLNRQTNIDALGRTSQTLSTSDPDGTDTVDATYDGLGRLRTTSNPHRSTTSSTDGTATNYYDALGRVCLVVPPDGTLPGGSSCPATRPTGDVLTIYSGNCATITDESGKTRKSCTDGLNRLTQVFEDPSGLNYETDYQYDTLDNLIRVDQKGSAPTDSSQWRTRVFSYDGLSRLLTATNPESGAITYTYDANSNVATKTAPQANQTGTATTTTSYCYDALNRLTGKAYTAQSCPLTSPAVTYGYDGVAASSCTPPALADSYPKARRTSMCDGAGSTAWSHDQMGRVAAQKRKIDTFNQAVSYTYNLDGSVSSVTYPTARVLSYTYNAAGRPLSLTDSTGPVNYVSACSTVPCYAPSGALLQAKYGAVTGGFAGITVQNSYNQRLQPALISATTPTPSTVLSLSYDFHLGSGDNGNVFQIANGRDSNRTQNFFYDNLNRIAQAYTNGNSPLSTSWGETFTIDAWGNLTNRSGVTGKTNYEGLNAAPASIKNQLNGYCHDAAGNLGFNAPCPVPYANPTYTYDAENRLLSTSGYTYSYDGDGNRVKKTNGSTGTIYWFDAGGEVINEANLADTMQNEYIFFGGKRVARRDVPTGHKHYYFSDHLGSASVVTSDLGVIQEESDYYPYGGEIAISNGDPNNYKFTGKERDTESGLDEFGARYYSSSLSRFMIPDWAAKPATVPYANFGNPQSLNLYGYVENNPTTTGDPDGHQEGAALNLDRDVNDLAAGRISEKEYMDRQKARGVGAVAGLSLVGAALAAPEAGIIVRNLIAVGLATAPRTVPIITDAFEGYVNPGSPGTLTISTATRLSEAEISTGVRLAEQTGKAFAQGRHVGEEFIDAAGKTYDAVNSPKAYLNWFRDGGKNVLDNIKSTLLKTVDYVVIDLRGASKEQIQAIKDYVNTLSEEEKKRIIYVK